MARIRTIKPEFWQHEDLSALPESTHILAAALINYADDFGFFNANPALIKAACFPIREPLVSVPESLRRLQEIGYVDIGTAENGRRIGRIAKFSDHQRVSHPTPSKYDISSITWDTYDDSAHPPELFRSPPETFRPEWNGMEQGTGNREQGKEKEVQSSADASAPSPPPEGSPSKAKLKKPMQPVAYSPAFERFWAAYHVNRKGKFAAFTSWKRHVSDSIADQVIEAAQAYSDIKTTHVDKFVCLPSTWLNQARWDDDPETWYPEEVRLKQMHRRKMDKWVKDEEAKEAREAAERDAIRVP